jgi:anti-sigma regulatory factor (Ser/Thr protein kinase)
LLLYTDGLCEARGPSGMFGETQLPVELARLVNRSATEMVTRLERAVLDYRTGTQIDDIAFLAVRLEPPVSVPEAAPRAVEEIVAHHSVEDALAELEEGRGGIGTCEIQVCLRASALAVTTTRHLVEHACKVWNLEGLINPAALVISELVTNAVRHAGTDLRIRVAHQDDQLLLSVHDQDPTLPALTDPARYHGVPLAQLPDRGRGLHLIEAYTSSWGYESTADGKTVWAILPAGHPRSEWPAGR